MPLESRPEKSAGMTHSVMVQEHFRQRVPCRSAKALRGMESEKDQHVRERPMGNMAAVECVRGGGAEGELSEEPGRGSLRSLRVTAKDSPEERSRCRHCSREGHNMTDLIYT